MNHNRDDTMIDWKTKAENVDDAISLAALVVLVFFIVIASFDGLKP